MKFGLVNTQDAEGLILAHGVAKLRKGRVLSHADLSELEAQGITQVSAIELEQDDVHEDDAAAQIAKQLAGQNLRVTAATTGRANIHATANGLACIDSTLINRINTLHPSITVATLKPLERVEAGQMIATVKIIPFASPRWAVVSATELAAGRPLSLAVFAKKRAVLVCTTLRQTRAALLDKTRDVIERRLAQLDCSLQAEHRTPHNPSDIQTAIHKSMALNPDFILIMGASATTDERDVVPDAIVRAGGVIEHFGMPVDPGNLLLLASISKTHIIGVPGCARSPKLNGLDFVLERLCANIGVRASDIQAMGVGGLLKEIPTRPHPRDRSLSPKAKLITSAIVLAAGSSSRMGAQNKLLLDLHGEKLIRRTVSAVLACKARETIVVTGHQHEAITSELSGTNARITHNSDYATGMASSLRTGLQQLSPQADGVLICLGDMPTLSPQDLDLLIDAFDPQQGRSIIVPVFEGKRGNPVLFSRQFFDEMLKLEGDTGAKSLLASYPEAIYEVEMRSNAILVDADTPAAFHALEEKFKKNDG